MKSALPGELAEIADVAGVDAAWALVRAYGGTTVYIPYEPRDDHWLTSLVGPEAAAKICAHFRIGNGGKRLLVPIARQGEQQRRLYKALEDGASATSAALAAGMHERSAFRARKRIKDKKQGSLF